ncbi:MAG: D-tyrosyl-tRNA(Tyr) deacylase [Lachnospiraceae bacterium]|nr:D-tyrosyl-tRNA(Tyr) deacylase [Lachnospiraceae bacterium]
MKFVIQRVAHASVTVDGECVGKIGKGFLVLVGVCESDTIMIADKLIGKLVNLRIFPDADGKTNLSLKDVDGELLIVSQFTLYADCKKGNRPSFVKAGDAELANRLYEYVIAECEKHIEKVEHGSFGAHMDVELMNDGPFTIILDSREIC